MGSGANGVFMVVALNYVVLDHKVEDVNVTVHLHCMVVSFVFPFKAGDAQQIRKQYIATDKDVELMGCGVTGLFMVVALSHVVVDHKVEGVIVIDRRH
jgi:hypothetical protein